MCVCVRYYKMIYTRISSTNGEPYPRACLYIKRRKTHRRPTRLPRNSHGCGIYIQYIRIRAPERKRENQIHDRYAATNFFVRKFFRRRLPSELASFNHTRFSLSLKRWPAAAFDRWIVAAWRETRVIRNRIWNTTFSLTVTRVLLCYPVWIAPQIPRLMRAFDILPDTRTAVYVYITVSTRTEFEKHTCTATSAAYTWRFICFSVKN